ncbi:MAG: CPBP family intramembrane metalloprotease [Candidatus Odyssella sp.]|nr:CPBP family intramembrane metalloprotease [Candidatus Odyssella sp.]
MSGPQPRPPRSAAPLGPPLRGVDVLRAILLGIALFVGAILAVRQMLPDDASTGARINVLIGSFAAWTFAWLAAIWFVFVRGRGLSFADLGYTVPGRRWALIGVGAGFGALPLALLAAALLRPALGSDSLPSLQQYFGSGADFTVFHAMTMLLYGGFLVPLTEELLFRGLLFRWLRQRLDFWPAALVSAALFGVAHGTADKAIIAGLLGLPLAWLFERSRSLAPAILLHQTYNSLALMLTFAALWLPEAAPG